MPIRDGIIRPLSRNAQMESYFGKAGDGDNMAVYTLPIVGRATLHKRVAQAFVAVFKSIQEAGLSSLIDKDSYGGTYCYRTVRGSKAMSPHAWAVAIDLNTDHIMRGGKEVTGTSNFKCSAAQVPESLKRLAPFFRAWGFTWGGQWSSYLDAMHFEATEYTVMLLEDKTLPEDAERLLVAAANAVYATSQPAPHDPPLLISPSGDVACEGRIIDGTLWTPTRKTLQAALAEVAWHPEQGKGYVVRP